MSLLRFLFAVFFSLGIGAVLWTQSGPFEWVGSMQLSIFGRHSVKLTLVLTILILLVPALLLRAVLFKTRSADMSLHRGGIDRASLLGTMTAAAAVVAIGLMPVIAPRPPVTALSLRELAAKAAIVPAQSHLSLSAAAPLVDRAKSVSVTMHRHSTNGTVYAPVHEPGSPEVTAVVSGTELDWQNAGILKLPFPSEANEAAVARAGDAILSLQPVPFPVRRDWAEQGLTVPLVVPAIQWGRSPLAVNVPLLAGGGTVFIVCGIALLRRPRVSVTSGRPPDM